MTYDAIVLCGGRSTRMRVADKTRLAVGGAALLDRVLAAVSDASRVVGVGEPRPVGADRPVEWTRESPVGGGPAAAVAAGLGLVGSDLVVVLAGDLPFVTGDVVRQLLAAVDGPLDGAVVVDAGGAPQWLCGAWRTAALRGADLRADASLRGALGPLNVAGIVGVGPEAFDCDTPDDLRRAEELV